MKKKKTSFLTIIFLIMIFLYSNRNTIIKMYNDYQNPKKEETSKRVISDTQESDILSIYYLDVGQADSMLITYQDKDILIDAGNNEDGPKLVNYFKSLNITKFDYVFGTHPHEDHIGGMDDIINNFEINNFYMPDVVTTTKTFEDILNSMEEKNLQFKTPNIDDEYKIGDIKLKVLYVGKESNDLNDTSIVLKLTYKDTSYLFTGDATKKVENKLLTKDIESDVLKVGHHGSQYSTLNEFLEKVNPKYAIIEVGKNNIYKHPKEVTLTKLDNMKIKYYRTDMDGTILLKSDGENISFEKLQTDTNG